MKAREYCRHEVFVKSSAYYVEGPGYNVISDGIYCRQRREILTLAVLHLNHVTGQILAPALRVDAHTLAIPSIFSKS